MSCKKLDSKVDLHCEAVHGVKLAKPFISMHIRYGNKVLEQKLQPFDKYMRFVSARAGYIKNIFLSTESEWVIEKLARCA